MRVGFGKFLLALAIVGLAVGGAFGIGVEKGRGGTTASAGAAATGTAGQAGARSAAGGAAGGSGAGANALAGRGNAITGTVQSVNGNTLVVRTSSGDVTVTANDQTSVRKLETGSLQDVKPGSEVAVVNRPATDGGAAAAASIQILDQSASASGNQGGRPSRPSQ